AGGALIAVGTFLPWVSVIVPFFGKITKSAMEGSDGIIFVLLGLAITAFGLAYRASRTSTLPALILGIVEGCALIYEFVGLRRAIDSMQTPFSVAAIGPGVWVVAIGTAGVIVAALVGLHRQGSPSAP